MKDDEYLIEKAIEDAAEFLRNEAGAPQDMFHPDYGWVLRNGKRTEGSEEFWKKVDSHRECKKENE